ncbi:hypothetical protein PHYBOEH_011050 [Phytophthora boehmeriae]|uniref:Fibrous sheath-interacting protein 1 n=1 Tax=Phytophthora boehmeriae TaxID=109152 RepID=A0A8T1X7U9_9STRA|nr:hypothetical protein PHYBOEH_011050 [Phytophthora boehmeriae]
MTEKDVRDDDSKEEEGKPTRQSWSRVLIESGLSKQQAFGILEDADDDPAGNSELAAKIALKMARVRQLDAILEEKLGKNLYASVRKQKKAPTPQPETNEEDPSPSNASLRTFVTQSTAVTGNVGDTTSRSSTSSSNRLSIAHTDVSTGGNDPAYKKKNNYFIERNKQVVANGMKANMTRDEEERLKKLLQDDASNGAGDDENPQAGTDTVLQERNEFAMADSDRRAIEEIIATKSGAYPLFSIDEQQDGPSDDTVSSPGDNKIATRQTKENIIQDTKRDRLQKQRLSRVEQELRFLQESPSVIIVGDDDDGEENDDCRSEKSFVTVASSTCSTRSGVISRHDFKCFLALQKEHFSSTPTASADEIRRLLLSVNQSTSSSANMVTATTV